MIRRALATIGLLVAALAPGAAAQPGAAPAADPLWTIASPDCVSVHADGEPWDECGFQAFAMNADGTRVLTVSAEGAIQLWDGEGREMKRVDWADDRSGASGYPSGRVAIVGHLGVAVAHHNQLLVVDLADGRVIARRIADLMSVRDLRVDRSGRLLAEAYDRDWSTAIYEIVLPGGELSRAPGLASTMLFEPPSYWIEGERAPFAVRASRPEGAKEPAVWACAPLAAHFCFRRDLPGRFIHVVDVRGEGGRSIDVGHRLGPYDAVYFAVAGERPYAVICGRAPDPYPPRRPCSILDMTSENRLYRFESTNLRAEGGLDEEGRPEIRLSIFNEPDGREQWRVSADGRMRVVDAAGRANLGPPGGGLILPGEAPGTSLLVDVAGRPVASLPFPAQACGKGWPDWLGWCRISTDGRRWLVPARADAAAREAPPGGLTLYAVPAPR